LTSGLVATPKPVSHGPIAIEWRDSGREIPEGDEARALIAEMDAQRRAQSPGQV
jgi:hypothetical protein